MTAHVCLRVRRRNGSFYLTTRDRFDSFVRPQPDGCHVWTGHISAKGYGKFGAVLAYRWNYEQLVGPVPVGMQLDHLCRNRACVRVDHLEPVTPQENTRRGLTYSPDVCPRGHLKVNPIVRRSGKYEARSCRQCQYDWKNARTAARRAARAAA